MRTDIKKAKGFTLMEVLVSTAIFAVVMLIATGVIAQGGAYNTKIKTMRETNQETRRLADMIARDVRSANIPLTFTSTAGATFDFKNGIALFSCDKTGLSCSLIRHTITGYSPSELTANDDWESTEANTIAISTKDGIKVYSNCFVDKTVYYGVFTGTSTITEGDLLNTGASPYISINSPSTETMIKFGGFCPQDDPSDSVQQSYVQFLITSKTLDYDSLSNTERAKAQLRSLVTGRSFNN